MAGFEHEDGGGRGGGRGGEEVPCDGSAGDSAADDDDVGRGGKVGGGAVFGEKGVGGVLPVACGGVGTGESNGDAGAFVHFAGVAVMKWMGGVVVVVL